MKNTVFMLFFIFFGINLYSQRVYYGYPVNDTLKKGDIAIVNLPEINLNNGRFMNWKDFDNLVNLLEFNKDNKLRIEINYSTLGGSGLCERVSKNLCKHLEEILEFKTVLKNYHIISNGDKNPIFLKKIKNREKNREKKIQYGKFNTRIEIFVE